ncbi:hypothetical protein BS47DRAFT_1397396 [Hydnum rufescens UP504]|uniref:Uncharacterized protein n=1 Tax=Hydnum rufescens UP504 TaxID=1448309 RepID=A0A9P6ANA1_9AGAM|nr:hypothetical protein BS47DRAFT_1397396 [Hydnum rufescens UP504]
MLATSTRGQESTWRTQVSRKGLIAGSSGGVGAIGTSINLQQESYQTHLGSTDIAGKITVLERLGYIEFPVYMKDYRREWPVLWPDSHSYSLLFPPNGATPSLPVPNYIQNSSSHIFPNYEYRSGSAELAILSFARFSHRPNPMQGSKSTPSYPVECK